MEQTKALISLIGRPRWWAANPKGTNVSYAHPMTLLVSAYVLPAALATYAMWNWYLQAAPQPRLVPARQRRGRG